MHKLARQVRFSINPFLPEDSVGFNSFSSKPAGEGLSIFFELSVQLVGDVQPATGFVANVADIDRNVRQYVVPIFAARIRKDFRHGKHIGFFELVELLKSAWARLADKFGPARLSKLSLKLNPFRKVAVAYCLSPIANRKSQMANSDKQFAISDKRFVARPVIYFSEKFEFAAMHKLWNDDFSQQRNFEVFGKCANPAGHGHNYVVEVTVKWQIANGKSQMAISDKRFAIGADSFRIGDFEKAVDDELIKLLDHKNLNVDVSYFARTIPTVENIAAFAWNKLVGKFGKAVLHCITVWETDKTCCSYYG